MPLYKEAPPAASEPPVKKLKFTGNNYPYCLHYFIDRAADPRPCTSCPCNERGFCIPICSCPPDCQLMNLGCKCPSKESCRTASCPCFAADLECDPEVCICCFNTHRTKKANRCANNEIQLNVQARTIIGESDIPYGGVGCFAGERIREQQLVGRYTGEVIEEQDYARQEIAQDMTFYTYNFKDSDKYAIDAKYFGNKTRFINHHKKQVNCRPKNGFSLCEYYMGIYAKRDLKLGEELFLNYDESGQLKKKFPWIGDD